MIIPINVTSSSSNPKLPPGLAKISHDEIVLIELQGALDVESNHPSERDGKLVGKLRVDAVTVSSPRREASQLAQLLTCALGLLPRWCLFEYPDKNKYTLLIGHHLLEGKIANIAKPLAVLLRSRTTNNATHSGTGAIRQDETDEDVEMLEGQQTIPTTDVEWDMIALVKRKIVFSKRPMPVVNLTARTT